MTERRVLVIGSQCKALGELSFLPSAARDIYAVMTDLERGSCVSALEGEGLLIDPTVQAAKGAISTAYARAALDEATLFITYIGHGQYSGDDFYLLPFNASSTPTSDTAINLTQLIKELYRNSQGRGVDGLGVLVDACYSGAAAMSVAHEWVEKLKAEMRFEVMTATSAFRPAADGCFTRNLTRILSDGLGDVPDAYLRCIHLRTRIGQACPEQDPPQHPAYNPDETLWLAKNGGRSPLSWAQTPLASEIERLTVTHQATPNLAEVVRQSQVHSCLAVVGEAGMGKSALAAALAWPEKAPQMVSTGFVQAIVLLNEAQTPQEIARLLSQQLCRSVVGFEAAQSEFDRITTFAKKQRLGALEKQVIEPLRLLQHQSVVRIVFDALDRLAIGAGGAVMEALEDLAGLPLVHLIVTSRPETLLPNGAPAYLLETASDEQVSIYLNQRAIPIDRRKEILATAQGNWLVVRVLADLLCADPDAALTNGRLVLADAFEELLARCGANSSSNTQIVLILLAAGGAGPVVPLALLCEASQRLEGPQTPARVRDELVRLRGLVSRSEAGIEAEKVGLFHQTLVEHILTREPEEAIKAHWALADAIAALAPPGTGVVDLVDPLQRYAFEREADHLWEAGDTEEALNALGNRIAASPRDNLLLWKNWERRITHIYEPLHPDILATQINVAYWTMQTGDRTEALRLLSSLLPAASLVLGDDSPQVLTARSNYGYLRNEAGNHEEALQIYQAVLQDRERSLGRFHRDTLISRNLIAGIEFEHGDIRQALLMLHELYSDQVSVLGLFHEDTLKTRNNIASAVGLTESPVEALSIHKEVAQARLDVLGADHPDTLKSRMGVAFWTGECGNAHEALRLGLMLLPELERVLGTDHPDTLITRGNIAGWTGKCGDKPKALRLFSELLPDQEQLLGAEHPNTLTTRSNIAGLTGECGDAQKAVRLFSELLTDQERVHGADHRDTLTTRHNIAAWTRECGGKLDALRLFTELLTDRERVLGADHQETLTTREWINFLSHD
jgi:tetratricopeptide (TPR) repeat protein